MSRYNKMQLCHGISSVISYYPFSIFFIFCLLKNLYFQKPINTNRFEGKLKSEKALTSDFRPSTLSKGYIYES